MAPEANSRRLTIFLSVALVGVLLIGVGVAAYLSHRNSVSSAGPHGSTSTVVTTTSGTATGSAASGNSTAATPGSGTSSTVGSSSGSTTQPGSSSAANPTTAASTAPDKTAGTGIAANSPSADTVVQLSDSAQTSKQAEAIRALVQNNFDAINNLDYALYTATSSNAKDETTWRAEYASTKDSDIMIHEILVGANGSTQVRMSFISQQSPELAPTDLPVGCIAWTVVYRIDDKAGALTIGESDSSQAAKKACAP